MTIKQVRKHEFSCDYGRLDCFGWELFDTVAEGIKEGWIITKKGACCPSKYCRRQATKGE